MLVLSMRVRKLRIALVLGVLLVICVGIFLGISTGAKPPTHAVARVRSGAKTNEERIAFLSSFGWKPSEEPIEIVEVIIPSEFTDVYENYNEIQKQQGYDLTKFKSKRVKRYTYAITNYPGQEEKAPGTIRANLLVYDSKIIGGDVCSVELAGFMHGFKMEN